jgi:hypothetical protein
VEGIIELIIKTEKISSKLEKKSRVALIEIWMVSHSVSYLEKANCLKH